MLAELRVRDLGVIADLELVLGAGLTALTGETGAGKTLVVEALELLLGGRADPTMVRAGASEALVEGRFLLPAGYEIAPLGDGAAFEADGDRANGELEGRELILARSVPSSGRSRAYCNGRMVPLATLEELGRDLVDLYGQHVHQSLLRPSAQREALDRFAGVELDPLVSLRRRLGELDRRIAELGGDSRTRLRELDLLRFERQEIEAARIQSAGEDEELAGEEELLAAAVALREATAAAHAALSGDLTGAPEVPSALERVGEAIALLGQLPGVDISRARLRAVEAELEDAAGELRLLSERSQEDPERLEEVRARRQLLRALVRKHGESLADVLEAGERAKVRIAELEATDATREGLEAEREAGRAELVTLEERIGDRRRKAAPKLAAAVESRLHELALPRARLELRLPAKGLGDEVEILLAANPGEPALPLAKVASGGELARTMLALRLVLTSAPPTLVFDEVDAGIGGEAAIAVGRALAELARDRQVVVVTHLPQVAAHAAHQVVVAKHEQDGRTVTKVSAVEGESRVAELSRMLAGRPGSQSARQHAEELLSEAAAAE